jgi:fructoselysine-6-P-deglycase FrlB-like protein
MRAKVKETYSSAIGAASAIRERSPRRVYVIGSGTSSYSALAASYAACALASPEELSVLAKVRVGQNPEEESNVMALCAYGALELTWS